ncbi:hypothetical protein KPL40_18490 [Clostridium gasigenes]|uniref:hypothetical protein n=1 Tax=Clostridium gasigenes TaxID=94869 RepID=UPI001C0E8EFB|nr:hypothetical protein [Clostridium gasigenes]MBU3134405.1 hypothetical protein [Clostridium gasigenes]
MHQAVEIYEVGKQREVNADTIEKKYLGTVTSNAKRFFCTSCGAYLSFVHIGKKTHKSFFRHCNINETTKTCNLRSKGNQQLSIYEKLGLPLYIKKSGDYSVELYLGFYSFEKQKLDAATRLNENISISYNNKYSSKYNLNYDNFSAEQIILKRLDFRCSKYEIKYSSETSRNILLENTTTCGGGSDCQGRALAIYNSY